MELHHLTQCEIVYVLFLSRHDLRAARTFLDTFYAGRSLPVRLAWIFAQKIFLTFDQMWVP